MLPSELKVLLTGIDALEAEAARLTSGLTETQVNWQPRDGAGWSVAQCLDHLARINDYYVAPFLQATDAAYSAQRYRFDGVKPTWFGRRWVAMLEPPVRRRMRSPKPVEPVATRRLPDVLETYIAGHRSYRELVEAAARVDVNRITAPNPFIKAIRVRVATALLVVPAHDRRHLWQARQVLDAADFPGRR
jgi:hypothetical protein